MHVRCMVLLRWGAEERIIQEQENVVSIEGRFRSDVHAADTKFMPAVAVIH